MSISTLKAQCHNCVINFASCETFNKLRNGLLMPSFYVKSLSRKMCVFHLIEIGIIVEASLLMATSSDYLIGLGNESYSIFRYTNPFSNALFYLD